MYGVWDLCTYEVSKGTRSGSRHRCDVRGCGTFNFGGRVVYSGMGSEISATVRCT